MINSVNSVYSRIRAIYDRINEIQKNILSINSTYNINSIKKIYNYEINQKHTTSPKNKTFQEVLREVMLESKTPEKTENINILSKPEESWKEVLNTNSRENKFDKIIEEASSKFGLPKELIKAVIKAESNFNPIAISPKNAMGLMQLMPSTAREMGVEDIFDPYQNIMGGSKYLKMLLDRYNGNLFLALSAYNAGPDRVDKTKGIPNIEETQSYIDRVLKFYKEYSQKTE